MKVLASIAFFCLSFFFQTSIVFGQVFKGQALETALLFGRVVPHSDETSFDIKENSVGLQLNYQWQTHGQKDWHELQRYPLFGLSALYFDLGEKEVFGNAVAVIPNLTISFLKRKKWNGHFFIGAGVAWLSEHYHRYDNPINNAIGSHWNNATLFKWGANYHPNNRFVLHANVGLMHFSNGGTQLPNFGINIPVVGLGLRYFPIPLTEKDYQVHHTINQSARKWRFSYGYSMAFREAFVIGGPRYPVYIHSLAISYLTTRINKFSIGLEHEYHQSDYAFGLQTYTYHTHRAARKAAARLAVSVGHEFLFGKWGIHLLSGFYVGDFSISKPYPFYLKLTARYYVPLLKKERLRLFLGVGLKSHLFRAEYIAAHVGMEF